MKKFIILTDSNSGIHQDEAESLGVKVIPMPFYINKKEFFEDISLDHKMFYSFLNDGVEVSTSQPSISYLTDLFDNLLKEYEQILYIPMSSGLSGTYSTAMVLANEYNGKVVVVDNKRISPTLKESVYEAIALQKQEKTPLEIKQYLEDSKYKNSIYIMVPNVSYLKKGGRLTPTAALLASMLRIKPVLYSNGDKFEKFATPITIRQAKVKMIEQAKKDLESLFKEEYENHEMALCVCYSENQEEALEFKKEVEENIKGLDVTIFDPLSLSVACHIGPGALAVALCVKKYK